MQLGEWSAGQRGADGLCGGERFPGCVCALADGTGGVGVASGSHAVGGLAARLAAAVVAHATGSIAAGIAAGAALGAAVGVVQFLLAVVCRADQVVVGVALNLASYGLTRYLLGILYDSTANSPQTPGVGSAVWTSPVFWLAALLKEFAHLRRPLVG